MKSTAMTPASEAKTATAAAAAAEHDALGQEEVDAAAALLGFGSEEPPAAADVPPPDEVQNMLLLGPAASAAGSAGGAAVGAAINAPFDQPQVTVIPVTSTTLTGSDTAKATCISNFTCHVTCYVDISKQSLPPTCRSCCVVCTTYHFTLFATCYLYVITGLSAQEAPAVEPEYLVKWLGRSHIHNEWVSESRLLALARRKLLNFKKRHGAWEAPQPTACCLPACGLLGMSSRCC